MSGTAMNQQNGRSTSSTWSGKLRTKLLALSDRPSTESVKTVAKWIGFNRKYADDFCEGFRELLPAVSSERQAAFLHVVHEVMILDHDEGIQKWDRLRPLRTALGQLITHNVLSENPASSVGGMVADTWRKHLPAYLPKWETCNSLGSHTMLQTLRKQLIPPSVGSASVDQALTETSAPVDQTRHDLPSASHVNAATGPTTSLSGTSEETSIHVDDDDSDVVAFAPTEALVAEHNVDAVDVASEEEEPPFSSLHLVNNIVDLPDETKDNTPSSTVEPSSLARITSSTASASSSQLPFDFEAYNIPARHDITAVELLEPSQQIMTLQIARDLGNDSNVQLSSLLLSLPTSIRAECAKADEECGKYPGLNAEQAMQFAKLLHNSSMDGHHGSHDVLLDMNVHEQMANIRNYRDLIVRQNQARKQVMTLMIATRGKLGSAQAAEKFYEAEGLMQKMQYRHQLLADAMELEGIDLAKEQDESPKPSFPKLPPLDWYSVAENGGTENTLSKRPRLA